MSNSNYLDTKLEEEIAKVVSEETKNLFKHGYLLTKVLIDEEEKDRFRLFFFDNLNPDPEHEVLLIMVRKHYDFYSKDLDGGFRDNFSQCNIYLGSVSRVIMDFRDIYSFVSFIDDSKKELLYQKRALLQFGYGNG